MQIKIESFESVHRELLPLMQCHHDELNGVLGVDLDIDFDHYIAIDRVGDLVTVVARDNGTPIAFLVGTIDEFTHHNGELFMVTDSFHVLHFYRNSGVCSKMYSTVEDYLKDKGVKFWMATTKADTTANQFLEKSGFKLHELTYMRQI